MKSILLYPRILFVARQPTITTKQLAKLLAKKTIPGSSLLPGSDIGQMTVSALIHNIESLSLGLEGLKTTYFEVNVLKSLELYGWVLVDRAGAKLLAAPIRGYAYQSDPNQAVQHFITFGSPAFSVPYSSINDTLMNKLASAKNLSELPAAAADLINAHRPASLRRTRSPAEKIIKIQPPAALSAPARPQLAFMSHLPATENANLPAAPTILFDSYFPTIALLHEFLNANLTNLTEQYHGAADLEYSGYWQDKRLITIQAFRLTGSNGHGGWKVRGHTYLPG